MGKQEGTVRGLQFRAIAALRRQLGIDVTGHGDAATTPPTGRRRGPLNGRHDGSDGRGRDRLRDASRRTPRSRLSPDLAASSRLRARVLAVAHRQAALARADAALTVLPTPDAAADAAPSRRRRTAARAARRASWRARRRAPPAGGRRRARRIARLGRDGRWQRVRRRPGGPLYDARLWAETLTLPSGSLGARRGGARPPEGSPARDRRGQPRRRCRRRDGRARGLRGDRRRRRPRRPSWRVTTSRRPSSRPGVGRNVEVLQRSGASVPANAGAAITARRRCGHRPEHRTPSSGSTRAARTAADAGGGSRAVGRPNPPRATTAPTAEPTPEPASTATPKPKPTHEADGDPRRRHADARRSRPTDPPEPTPTPKPPKPRTGRARDPGRPGAAAIDPPGGGPQRERRLTDRRSATLRG